MGAEIAMVHSLSLLPMMHRLRVDMLCYFLRVFVVASSKPLLLDPPDIAFDSGWSDNLPL
jgi:hypothetical protein